MTDTLDLSDIDTDPDWDTTLYLELETRYPDGTMSSYFYVIENSDDIATVAESFLDDETQRRIARLSDAEKETYYEHYDPDQVVRNVTAGHVCTCHGACFCYDVPEEFREETLGDAFSWLDATAGPGPIVTWRWRPFGASGSDALTGPSIDFVFGPAVTARDGDGKATEMMEPLDFLPW